MVGPSPIDLSRPACAGQPSSGAMVEEKQHLRARMRAMRREHVASLADATSALLFMRPPAPVAALVPAGASIGLYCARADEAPTIGYARWFAERGHRLALPWFSARGAPMTFRAWTDPFGGTGLSEGPYGPQPEAPADLLSPDIVLVPLLAFTAHGERLGQGGGHYDRWLEAHPQTVPIGMAWDCQLVDSLPGEAHDRPMRAVVTPTRIWQKDD
jgi:5-formyltetrahydrofolate cyclo-ligase